MEWVRQRHRDGRQVGHPAVRELARLRGPCGDRQQHGGGGGHDSRVLPSVLELTRCLLQAQIDAEPILQLSKIACVKQSAPPPEAAVLSGLQAGDVGVRLVVTGRADVTGQHHMGGCGARAARDRNDRGVTEPHLERVDAEHYSRLFAESGEPNVPHLPPKGLMRSHGSRLSSQPTRGRRLLRPLPPGPRWAAARCPRRRARVRRGLATPPLFRMHALPSIYSLWHIGRCQGLRSPGRDNPFPRSRVHVCGCRPSCRSRLRCS